jgi:soluble lytic murein transglycosylase
VRLRDLVLLVIALCLLSALVGTAVLVYLYVWRAPPVASTRPPLPPDVLPTLSTPTTASTADASTPTPLPGLITPTNTYTPSPTATPSLTPSPTLTPTPTQTPTPTPIPAARLANAHRAKRNGDYRLARSEFRAVLEAPGAEWEAKEALYGLGVCAYLDGEYAAARDLLCQFQADYPQDHRVAASHFYVAQSLAELQDHDGAIAEYRMYLDQQDVLADLIYTRIGDTLMASGDYEAAAGAYERALERALDLDQQYDLREQIGVAYSAWGRYDESIEWLRGITERSQNVHRLARVWYLIGQVHRMAGREQEALDAFTKAAYGDPRPGYAYAALVALVEAYVEVDDYQRGLIDYYAGSYGAAVAAFYRYMELTPDYNSDAHYYAALSYLNSGSFDLAVQECERALSAFPNTILHWGELWLLRAEALAELDRLDDAVAVYVEFADTHPGHPLAPEARWAAAQLLEKEDRFGEASDTYTTLADRHVNAERAPEARFRAGICRYRDGDWDAALVAWKELVNGYPGSAMALRGRYWQGKVLWTQGETIEAQDLLQSLADEFPRDYYGLRAAHLIANNGHSASWPKRPDGIHQTSDDQTERQEAEAWLRSWTAAADDIDLSDVPQDLADDIRFRRGMEFLSLGLRDAARDEFDALRRDMGQDPVSLYRFALLARDLGLYAPSLRAAIDLIVLAPEDSVLEMPRFVQRLAFPLYFSDLIVAESQSYDIDPLLIFALIRQESVFDDQITSWAGAVGLTQIMPATGEWIAELMPWPEYQETDLKRAYLNARFGIWFMSRILEMTDGDIPAALAGYNGGPGNGVYWFEESRGDPDLFIEVINRDEPQQYVRQIYRHYDAYQHLYGSK